MQSDDLATAPVVNVHWLAQLKAMDSHAWDNMVRYYAEELEQDIIRSLRKRNLSESLADEIQQETWRTAIEKIDTFEAETAAKFYNWMRVIALNKVRMLQRKRSREVVSLDSFSDDLSIDGATITLDRFLVVHHLAEDDAEVKVLFRERVTALEHALSEVLSERDREIFIRRTVNEEKPRDLARIYGVEARTISTILYRAKQQLEKHLLATNLFKHEKERGD